MRHRTALADELRLRTAELAALRDERAALVVADDRGRLSERLDTMLQARLARLADAAETGPSLGPDAARALFAEIEADGRRTLDDMRDVVGRLRGEDAALAPAPVLAHLDALLARRAGAGTRLVVTGDPAGLPPSVELSVYRIVEHLVGALSDRPDARVDVEVRVDGDRARGAGGRSRGPQRDGARRAGPRPGARPGGRRVRRPHRRARPRAGRRRAARPRPGLSVRRLEQVGIVLTVLLAVVVPVLVHGRPTTPFGVVFVGLIVVAGLALLAWRSHPRAASTVSLGLLLVAFVLGPDQWFPDTAIVVLSAGFAVLALGWSGRAAVGVAVVALGYVVVLVALGQTGTGVVPSVMFTLPGFVAGTIFRLRRETADALARRAAELEREQEELTALSVRHERRRIAGELHDVVGHAVSVLVIQAAAGQRLVDAAPERVEGTFDIIAESARRGTADLERLVELLGGTEPAVPDLGLVDEVVAHAVRSGLDVRYRVEGERAVVPERAAHVVHRVVQEGLTNALRHAPGASVRIRIVTDVAAGAIDVTVENDAGVGRGRDGARVGLRSGRSPGAGRGGRGPAARRPDARRRVAGRGAPAPRPARGGPSDTGPRGGPGTGIGSTEVDRVWLDILTSR